MECRLWFLAMATKDQDTTRGHDAEHLELCLRPTFFLDADHSAVRKLASDAAGDASDAVERAVRLYRAVRDGFRYDPYGIDLTPEGFRASRVIERDRGFCVTKAGLLAAVARAAGIPARLGFADVRNHLATERLRRTMGTDVFYYHGFTELFLDGKWVKATPAFNIELCEKFGVPPLEFDGRHDSLFQPFDTSHRRYMEYIREHGSRVDMPFEEIRDALRLRYPNMMGQLDGDFHDEAAAESRD
jgi:transglutaminase-like putative cysteine protease